MAEKLTFGQFKILLQRKGAKPSDIDRSWRTYNQSGDINTALRQVSPNPIGPNGSASPVSPGRIGESIMNPNPIGPNGPAAPSSMGRFPTEGIFGDILNGTNPGLPILPQVLLPDINFGRGGGSAPPMSRQAPSASMPGEHSGSRISESTRGLRPNTKNIQPPGRLRAAQSVNPMDAALQQMMAAYDAAMNAPQQALPQYGDFTNQARSLVDQIYAPQFAALSGQENAARKNYTINDKVTEGLYAQLQNDLRNTLAGTQQNVAALNQGNTQNTQQLIDSIKGTYGSEQNQLADVMKNLGLEAAATSLAPASRESAFQQNQASTLGKLNSDYINNVGQNQQNYTSGLVDSSGAAGAAQRQQLIRGLVASLGQIGSQRAQLGSQEASSVLDQANQMADRDFQAQQARYNAGQSAQDRALSLLGQKYGLMTSADATNWDRAFKTQQLAQQAMQNQAQAGAYNPDNYSDYGNLITKLTNTYRMPDAASYVAVATDVLGGGPTLANGSPNPAFKDVTSFIQQVMAAGAAKGLTNKAALAEVANQMAKGLGFKTTGY